MWALPWRRKMALPNSMSSPAVLSVANLGVILAWVGAANNIQIMLSTGWCDFSNTIGHRHAFGLPSSFDLSKWTSVYGLVATRKRQCKRD